MTLRVPPIRQRPFGCPLGAAARLGSLQRIGKRIAAVITRRAGDLLRPRYAVLDHLLGQPVGHRCVRMPA
jgi:hypothetical protein